MNNFTKQLFRGQSYEYFVMRYFERKGFVVERVESGHGYGQRIEIAGRQYTGPDLILHNPNHHPCVVEVKNKDLWSFHRISGTFTTGIDLNGFNNLVSIQQTGEYDVYLMFIHDRDHENPNLKGVYMNHITTLSQKYSHKSYAYGKGGMIYWNPIHFVKIELKDLGL